MSLVYATYIFKTSHFDDRRLSRVISRSDYFVTL